MLEKNLYCCKGTVKGNSGERGGEPQSSCRIQSGYEQNVSSNMDGKGHSDEFSERNEEYVFGSRKKGDPCYKVAKKLS